MSLVGVIERINGSLIIAKFEAEAKIGDLVEVGNLKLMGEIVRLSEETAYIQCYETTSGVRPGEPVVDLGKHGRLTASGGISILRPLSRRPPAPIPP